MYGIITQFCSFTQLVPKDTDKIKLSFIIFSIWSIIFTRIIIFHVISSFRYFHIDWVSLWHHTEIIRQ